MHPVTVMYAVLMAVLASLLALPVMGADTDGDGLSDDFERTYGVTDYQDRDSDHDGVIDSAEDNDNDRLGNLGEQRWGTNPGRWDTNSNGTPDGKEDADGDGRTNAREQDQRAVPRGLTPALNAVTLDRQPDRVRCQAKFGETRVRTCTFGNAGSDTTVVLAGDSHATAFLTPIKQIAAARGWKLVTMTKASCPAFVGMTGLQQVIHDQGVSCRRWRRNVIARLNAHPPAFLIYDHAPYYRLHTVSGTRIPESQLPTVWRESVKRTLAQLPPSTKVLLMGGTPHNDVNPVKCLRRHPANISRCVTGAKPAAQRTVDNAIRAAATNKGARYATLHAKICSYDPCPVIQGNIMMWRDGGHLSETFAKQLKPSIAAIFDRKLAGSGK